MAEYLTEVDKQYIRVAEILADLVKRFDSAPDLSEEGVRGWSGEVVSVTAGVKPATAEGIKQLLNTLAFIIEDKKQSVIEMYTATLPNGHWGIFINLGDIRDATRAN